MKKSKILIALIACLALANKGFTQSSTPPPPANVPTTDIEYDFNGKTLHNTNLTQMKAGAYYRVIVHGINNNLYKISIGARDTVNSPAVPMPVFSTLDITGIASTIAGVLSPATTITNSVLPGQANTRTANIINAAPQPRPTAIAMAQYKRDLTGFGNEIADLKTREDNLILNIYGQELNMLLVTPANVATTTYSQALAAIISLRADLNTFQTKVINSEKLYDDFATTNKAEIAANADLTATDKTITAAYTSILSGCTDLLTTINAANVKTLLTDLINLQNNSGSDYTSLPFQFRNDQAKFVLVIEPRDPTNARLNTYKQELDFPLFRKNYAAVGVSFYGATLYDAAYTVVGTPVSSTVTNYQVKAENYSKFEIGMTALLRLGTKFGDTDDKWGGHFSIGPGVSMSNSVKPRILTGGGFSYGEKHMFTIDAGLIAGYVNRLSSAIDLNNTTLSAPPTSTTVSRLSAAGFLSIGYLYRFP